MRDSIGIGVSQESESSEAGQQAARMAMQAMKADSSVAWALAFCGGKQDPHALFQGLRLQLGDVEIIGGSSVGTITHRSIGYSGYECAVAVFSAAMPKPITVAVDGLNEDEVKTGRQLGARLHETANEGDTVLLFYDSVRSSPPPMLNVGSRLVEGIYAGLAGKQLNIIGAGMIGDFQMTRSFVFDGRQPVKHGVVAAVLPGVFSGHTTIIHGCIPFSSFLEITKVDGPVIYEIDHRPALTVIQEMVGEDQSRPGGHNLSLLVTLGEKHGDLYAPYDESNYVNRLIISTNPDEGSLTLFEADFQAGTKIQLMARSNQMMLDSVRKRTKELLCSLGSSKPIWGFYIDCAGRSSAFSGADVEEASILQDELGDAIPLLGFYSGVELAPLLGRTRPLDWTGVLTLFTLEHF
jgi:hypothetical protein